MLFGTGLEEEPQCKTQLGRDILGSDRYVDDVLSSHNHAEELLAAMEDMEYTLEQNGSTIKKILVTNYLTMLTWVSLTVMDLLQMESSQLKSARSWPSIIDTTLELIIWSST